MLLKYYFKMLHFYVNSPAPNYRPFSYFWLCIRTECLPSYRTFLSTLYFLLMCIALYCCSHLFVWIYQFPHVFSSWWIFRYLYKCKPSFHEHSLIYCLLCRPQIFSFQRTGMAERQGIQVLGDSRAMISDIIVPLNSCPLQRCRK